ncbi:meiosis-specific protein ASY2-like [Eutrema salsugineum]|uniref:meiosis-specific protein ASY2-like n=1 Tax=Eutrema salsugineum TaxID=72664 RepID=UPI000CED34DD|nr:meiosis-specific protein ASY2-like [Eutrema salsugineum]
MSLGGQRIESSLESGSASDQEVSVNNSSSPEAQSRSESRSDREESPLVELADRLRPDGASSQREASNLQVVEIDEDSREGDAVEQAEDEIDKEDNEEEGEQTKPRKKGSKRKGNIKNRLVDIRSRMTPERLEEMRALYGFHCELRSPGPDDRPWLAPVGWVTLYEASFSMRHLWVPLPRLLTDYADWRCIALSQILPAGIRYMVAALLFGSEVGVSVDWRFFEEMTTVQRNNSIPGTYTIKAGKNCSLIYPVNRTSNWEASFFYAKVDESLVVDTARNFRNEWSQRIGRSLIETLTSTLIRKITSRIFKSSDPLAFRGGLTFIVGESRLPSIASQTVSSTPIQVNAPSLAARLKDKKSESKDRGPTASRPVRSDPVPSQEEVEVDPQRVAEVEVEAQSAEDQVEARQPDDEADEATQSARAVRDDKGLYLRGPPGTDGAFKDMASFAFKFIASCNCARGQYMRWLRNGAARLKDAQAAGEKAGKERDAAIEERRVAEDNWQTMKRKAEQLDVGVKELTDKIEAMKQENLDLVNNLQIINEAKIQVEKWIATEVVRAQRQADERIEAETTRIWADAEAKYSGRIDRLRIWVAQQEAIEKDKLDLVQARGTLECLDLLKEQEMSEAELRAELESSKRDCEQKLENLSFTDLEEGDLPPPYPETPDGGSDRDDAEDEENHEGGNEPEE